MFQVLIMNLEDLEDLFKIYLPDLFKFLVGNERLLRIKETALSLAQACRGTRYDVNSLGARGP